MKQPPHEHATLHSGIGYSRPVIVPRPEELQRAADVLNAGRKVAMLVGAGAQHASAEVLEVADLLGAGIAKALLGKPVVPDTLSYVTGGIGFLGTRASYEMMNDCDTLLMVGSSFPYAEFLPAEGSARGVQIDIDGRMLSLRYPMEVNLEGDSAATLRALIPLLARKEERRFRERVEKSVADWWQTLEKRAMQDAEPVNPQRVFWELSPRLPDNAMLACDTGSAVHWYSRDIRIREGMRAAHSGGLASMGAAIPYAIAAKFAHPDRPAFAFVGDGAMQMSGLNELITVAKYGSCWHDPRFVVIVLNNRDLGFVTWEQRVLQGDPKFPASQDLPDFSYAGYARLLGFTGVRVDHPAQIVPALDDALTQARPALIEVVCDPDIPPLPPHVSAKQARDYLLALAKGDPDSVDVLRKSLRQMLA
jgi:pyruvate dehydrogenase (quinone)